MAIFSGSRYQGLKFVALQNAETGVRRRFMFLRVGLRVGSTVRHRLVQGDALDLLAMRYGGESRHWWRIADENDLFWPLDLEPGTELKIPF